MDNEVPTSGRGGRWVLLAIPAMIAVTGLAMLVGMWRPALFFGHPLEAISYSLGAEAGSGIMRSPDDCENATGGMTCSVTIPDPSNDSSSYSVPYEVTVDRLGCWNATRLKPKPNHKFGAKHLNDCLGIRDYYQPLEAPGRYK